MDIVMPGLNGFQATRQLSKDAETSHIPVIIVTTKDQETDKVWGKRQGARDYLTKPINVGIARQRIRNLILMDRLRKEVEAQRDHLEDMVKARTAALSIAASLFLAGQLLRTPAPRGRSAAARGRVVPPVVPAWRYSHRHPFPGRAPDPCRPSAQ